MRVFKLLRAAASALVLASPAQFLPGDSALADPLVSTVRSDTARAPERERLFRFLALADSEAEGRAMEMEIWRFWLEAPDAASAELMSRALERRRAYDFSGALALLDTAVEHAPDWAEAWNQRATVLFGQEQYDRALTDIERVLELEPKHFGAMAGQAIILMRYGRFDTAQAILRRAVTIHPYLAERTMILPKAGEPDLRQPGNPL